MPAGTAAVITVKCAQHTSFKLSVPKVLMVSSQAAAAPGTVTVSALNGSNSPPVTPSSLAFCTKTNAVTVGVMTARGRSGVGGQSGGWKGAAIKVHGQL